MTLPKLITREVLLAAKVGDALWDMHNGMEMDPEVAKDNQFQRANIPVALGMRLCEEACGLRDMPYTNKYLMVIGVQTMDAWLKYSLVTACFVYDGKFSRILSFEL